MPDIESLGRTIDNQEAVIRDHQFLMVLLVKSRRSSRGEVRCSSASHPPMANDQMIRMPHHGQ
jgi:hypothetical protein